MPHLIPQDIPASFQSERLFLRAPAPGDGLAHHLAVTESLEALHRFPASLRWALQPPSQEASEAYCKEAASSWQQRTSFPLLVFLKDSEALAGGSGLHDLDWTVPKGEIGCWIRSSFAGRGLGSEVLRTVARFGFENLGLRRIYALPDDDNAASWHMCERAGLALEGVMRQERAEPGGRLRNTRLYAVVR